MRKEASSIITNQNNLSDKSKKKLETLYADVVAVRKMGKLENAIGPVQYVENIDYHYGL